MLSNNSTLSKEIWDEMNANDYMDTGDDGPSTITQSPTISIPPQKPIAEVTISTAWACLELIHPKTAGMDMQKIFVDCDCLVLGRTSKIQSKDPPPGATKIALKLDGVPGRLPKYVSRDHFMISKQSTSILIRDLASTNGTYINGKRITGEEPIRHGDYISIVEIRTVAPGQYITLYKNGSNVDTQMVANEQEWKIVLSEQPPNGMTYRFSVLDIGLQTESVKSVNRSRQTPWSIRPPQNTIPPPVAKNTPQNTLPPPTFEKPSKDTQPNGLIDSITTKCNEEFTCSICYNLFVEPTTLECGHTFCGRCLGDWVLKQHNCPLCRKKVANPPQVNLTIKNLLQFFVENLITNEARKVLEERARIIQQKDDEDLAKLHGMIENANAKKIKFLKIQERWKLEEKRTFRNGVKQYVGKPRDDFCALVGLTENYARNCNSEELIIACDNLEIAVCYMIVGQEIKTMRRVVDLENTRQKLVQFCTAQYNLIGYL